MRIVSSLLVFDILYIIEYNVVNSRLWYTGDIAYSQEVPSVLKSPQVSPAGGSAAVTTFFFWESNG
jgi:hypothetical protein